MKIGITSSHASLEISSIATEMANSHFLAGACELITRSRWSDRGGELRPAVTGRENERGELSSVRRLGRLRQGGGADLQLSSGIVEAMGETVEGGGWFWLGEGSCPVGALEVRAMAKTRSKTQGKSKNSAKKVRKKGADSESDAIRTKSIDAQSLKQSEGTSKVKITLDDIEEEDKIDKVRMLTYGVFIIRFNSMEYRDQVLNGTEVTLQNCRPAWYPIMVDSVTRERDRLNFARVLVEVLMKQDFPSMLKFEDEFGKNSQKVGTKQEWVIKEDRRKEKPATDDEGFLVVSKGKKIKEQKKEVSETKISNGFQVLADVADGNEGTIVQEPKGSCLFFPNGIVEKKPFKYFRMWKSHPEYDKRVAEVWRKAKNELDEVQGKLQEEPLNAMLHELELAARNVFLTAQQNYQSFMQLKAKISWIQDGYSNTSLFHASIKQRNMQNQVYSIENDTGIRVFEPDQVISAFISYYKSLLGSKMANRKKVSSKVLSRGPMLSSEQAAMLTRPRWILKLLFQDNWELMGEDLYRAVTSFLDSCKILKEINTTVLTMVPKMKCPNIIKDFRPITCCNVIYKIATKLLCSRIKCVLPELVSSSQGGFIQGRFIEHNIMICQDLVRHY
uniref:Reverse transcriptase domain-containing protein n=1 Tax=Cannabis sativa TaxID=3483 RepID=A0A803Q842_CANSA